MNNGVQKNIDTHITQNFDKIEAAQPAVSNKVDWLSLAKISIVPQGVELPKPVTLFEMAGIPLMTKNEMSLLIAKPKQGKSTVASWIISQLITHGKKVLVVDTEMGQYYSSRSQYWALNAAGLVTSDNLTYLDLKKYSPSERMNIINAYLKEVGISLDLVVIDGTRDLLIDINKSDDFMPVINELMKWAVDYDLHILNILHKNKVDVNARGGIGTELQNKCETTMDVNLEGAQIVVCPIYTRNQPFEPFVIVRDTYGIPKLGEGYTPPVSEAKRKEAIKWHDVSNTQHSRLLIDVFANDAKWKASALRTRLKNVYDIHFNVEFGRPKIDSLIDYLANSVGLISRVGKGANDPKAYYEITTQQVTQQVDLTPNEL